MTMTTRLKNKKRKRIVNECVNTLFPTYTIEQKSERASKDHQAPRQTDWPDYCKSKPLAIYLVSSPTRNLDSIEAEKNGIEEK